ncbi:LacI family transcriptional regulator [Ensifer adhaerens]|uniref:LacI family DNA-binding transcriptional regulator n=1 Tax=Ensifer adhaerens TaxID=106592 RepID=UPI001CBBF480|nr:LacI family DNA-binding transcriptional regulator [Ensifer adhaerens]MBZ7924374.1 LacI family transcriptional regulator [Ensifer adhaerens]UAX96379.1 LacI family transcriptional regulator [Ensifer adhaerens]UAY04278.1 LacI family transcriptional regulator [Ensifer adhaerens]UAY12264.1 LacI family transcriptional regulator [Ensifer adhaerens]
MLKNELTSKRSTIRDVAKAAGMSIASVSRALKDPSTVRPDTRAKVLTAANELGFQVNRLAVDFRTGRTHTLMVLVPNIANPFYSEFFKGIEEAARLANYLVLIADTASDAFREADYFSMLTSGKCDGLIAHIGRFPENVLELFAGESAGRFPIVSCNRDAGVEIPTVGIDNYGAGRQAALHLLALGHRRFGQIVGPMEYEECKAKHAGFVDTLLEAGISHAEECQAPGDLTIASGRAAARKLFGLHTPPSALFIHSDEMALGAIQELRSCGINVPSDVSVVSFDDVNFASAVAPALTTIRVPRREWGAAACRLLLAHMEGKEAPEARTLTADLVVRESTAAPS